MNSNNYNDSLYKKILDSCDIVEVIGHYIDLEKKGKDYKGICPFHHDTDPSLSVDPAKQVFKCFACNTSGNAISFISKYKNVTTFEAMKEVAQIAKLNIDFHENPTLVRNRKYYNILNQVSEVYETVLNFTNEGVAALDYLNNKRKIDKDVIKRFRIGLSNHDGNAVEKALVATNKVSPLDLQDLGILYNDRNKNHYYDFFRGRITFPLKDLQGNIVGFSGRIYDTKSDSKYKNSTDNAIFKKNMLLYNYSDAINEIKQKDSVIVFEGFMDVIAAYKAGVYNTVATMGTALTENQVKTIANVTKNVTLCYDGDAPGIHANKVGFQLFTKYGCKVNTIVLEDGLDPDEYFDKYGKDATYNLLMNNRVNTVDYSYIIEKRNLNINDPASIMAFEQNIYSLVNSFDNNAIKKYLLDKMAKDLNISLDDVISDYSKNITNIKINKANEPKVIDENEGMPDYEDYPDIPNTYYDAPVPDYQDLDDNDVNLDGLKQNKIKVKSYNQERYINAENGLISLSLKSYDDCLYIKHKLGIDEFVDKINRNILLNLFQYYDLHKTMNLDDFMGTLKKLEMDRLNAIINSESIFLRSSIDDYIKVVNNAKYYRAKSDLLEDIKNGNADMETIEKYIKCKNKTIKIKEGKK